MSSKYNTHKASEYVTVLELWRRFSNTEDTFFQACERFKNFTNFERLNFISLVRSSKEKILDRKSLNRFIEIDDSIKNSYDRKINSKYDKNLPILFGSESTVYDRDNNKRTYVISEDISNYLRIVDTKLSAYVVHLSSKVNKLFMYAMYGELYQKPNYGLEAAYIPTKRGIYLTTELPTFSHEIGHMIEAKRDSQIYQQDWGLTFHVEDLSLRGFYTATACETRVRAFEAIVRSEQKPTLNDNTIIKHQTWNPYGDQFIPFGKFKKPEDVTDWSNAIFERIINTWDRDRVEAEWSRRIDLLNHWMETAD